MRVLSKATSLIEGLPHLAVGQHQDVLLLFGESELPAREARLLQLALGQVQLAGDDAGDLLLAGDPVEGHLRSPDQDWIDVN